MSLDTSGEPIPLLGFGLLTAISLVPSALAHSASATKALLMLTHLVAAAIAIPAASRWP